MAPKRDDRSFLLMMLTIAACASEGEDAQGSTAATTTASGTMSADGGDAPTSDGGSTGAVPADGSTTSEATSGSSGAGTDGSADDSSTADPATTTGIAPECAEPPYPAVCEAAGEKWSQCIYAGDPRIVGFYAGSCACRLALADDEYGADCVAALEDYYACLSTTDCMILVLQNHCFDEWEVISSICPSLSPV